MQLSVVSHNTQTAQTSAKSAETLTHGSRSREGRGTCLQIWSGGDANIIEVSACYAQFCIR